MKHLSCISSAIIGVICFYSCSNAVSSSTDIEKLGLKGEVKEIKTETSYAELAYSFNRKGELIKFTDTDYESGTTIYYFKKGKLKSSNGRYYELGGETYENDSCEYIYENVDNGHDVIYKVNADGKKTHFTDVYYDKSNRIIKIGENTYTYEADGKAFDEKGNYVIPNPISTFEKLEFLSSENYIPECNEKGLPILFKPKKSGWDIKYTITYWD